MTLAACCTARAALANGDGPRAARIASRSTFGGFHPGGGTVVRSSKTSFVFCKYLCHPLRGILGDCGTGADCGGEERKK
jgi:hypothetical protein